MKINEVIGEWIIMPQSIKPMGLIHKKGVGPTNRFDFKNKNNNRANEAPIEQDKDNPVAKPYVDMPEWKALHDMDDKIIDAYIKHKEITEADDNSVARVLGKAEASLMHGLEMAQNIIKKDYDMAEVQAKVIAQNWPPLIDNIKNIYKTNEKAPPGREKQVKALKGKVDNPYAVAWASYNKSKGKKEDAAGVGIITKQNTTKDVKPGDEYKNVKKLHLS